MSDKILRLELWAKIPPVNPIARFFKMQYLKEEMTDEFYCSHIES